MIISVFAESLRRRSWSVLPTVNIGGTSGEHSNSVAGTVEIYQHLINDGDGVAATKIIISVAATKIIISVAATKIIISVAESISKYGVILFEK